VEADDRVLACLGATPAAVTADGIRKSKQILGNLLLGRCAEIAFETIYREEMRTNELELVDLREARNDTDYRVLNGQRRPVYRLNIKFHGSSFRRAPELVGLRPEDCFALATYKIYSAQLKQAEERLPYIFAIVGVPGLTGESVGERFQHALVDLVALLHASPRAQRKRDIEDTIVNSLVNTRDVVFVETYSLVHDAKWYVLSASKAVKLLREKLFDRVFALKIRGFARVFGRAELDMHFSLQEDLVPLTAFLRTLREEGPTKVSAMLTGGDY
jgi:hypothetical protein